MKIEIKRSTARGEVVAPPSKSLAHRYLICAALSEGVSVISNVDLSEDILATIDCIKALGADVKISERKVTVTGRGRSFKKGETVFSCRESGSTVRFFMPVSMMLCESAVFTGSGRLMERPFSVYEDICREESIDFEKHEGGIFVSGKLIKNAFSIPGDISSQFVTGLMYALALSGKGGKITLTGNIESRSYINLTMGAFNAFGVKAEFSGEREIMIEPGNFKNSDITVEGDASNAAFLDAFNLAGGSVSVTGLNKDSAQGDMIYKKYFNMLLSVKRPKIDISDCPDLGPVLMAVLSLRGGGGILTGTKRLKIKESDRGVAMAEELEKFGIKTQVGDNSIEIFEGSLQAPKTILSGHNDHRIVMALSVCLSVTGGEITGAEAVKKSFPDYFSVIKGLGIEVIEDGMD